MLLVMEQTGSKKQKFHIMRHRIAETCFLLALFCELLVSVSGYAFGFYGEPKIILLGMVLFSAKILLTCNWKKDWVWFLICGSYGLLCYYFQSSALILRIALFCLAARDQDAEKGMKIFFWGTTAIMLYAGVLSALGRHNTLYLEQVFRNETERRWCFGFFHPNGFSFFVFRTMLLGLYLYGKKMPATVATFFFAVTGIFIFLAGSKMGIFLFVAVVLAFIIIRFWNDEKKVKLFYYAGNTAITAELLLICSALWFMETVPGTQEGVGVWDFFNRLTTGRLYFANKIWNEVSPGLFGFRDFMEATEIGLVNMFYNQGIIFALGYIILVFVLQREMYRKKNMWGMLLILAFMGYSLSEAFIPYVNKNAIWMLVPFLEKGISERQVRKDG